MWCPGCEVVFTALIEGRTSASVWEFGDGTVVSNRPYASSRLGGLGRLCGGLAGV